MSIIRPELARTRSDENAWLKLSVVARRALDCAIANGKTKVRVHYRNNYQYFWNDIRILKQIGYEVECFDGVVHKDFTLEEFIDPNWKPTSEYVCYIEISW